MLCSNRCIRDPCPIGGHRYAICIPCRIARRGMSPRRLCSGCRGKVVQPQADARGNIQAALCNALSIQRQKSHKCRDLQCITKRVKQDMKTVVRKYRPKASMEDHIQQQGTVITCL